MKSCVFFFLLLGINFSGSAQAFSKTDSLELIKALVGVFNIFDRPDIAAFQEIANHEINCLVCSGVAAETGHYRLSREKFFKKYLEEIRQNPYWLKASEIKDLNLQKAGKSENDFIVFLTTWEPDEIAPGHGGGQLGIHFKKIDNQFIFSGIETIR